MNTELHEIKNIKMSRRSSNRFDEKDDILASKGREKTGQPTTYTGGCSASNRVA